MSDRRSQSPPRPARRQAGGWLAVAAGMVAAAGLAACGSASSSSGGSTTGITRHSQPGAVSALRLRTALLTRINGVGPATSADAGSFGALRGVQAAAAQVTGLTVTPGQCAQATVLQAADLDTGALGAAPAAMVGFRVGTNAISEVLAVPATAAAAAALSKPIPAGCSRYTGSAGGKTYRYTARQDWVSGIGTKPARALNITTSGGGATENVWSLLYQGAGFIGAITVTGPNASEAAVRELGRQAYAYAAKSLS
jgi:hypothetical protein